MQRLNREGQKICFIENVASRLEVALYAPQDRIRDIVVLCHPHPLLGGNMDDPVLNSCADYFEGTDKVVARLNFRGVGGSSGSAGRLHAWEAPLESGVQPEINDLIILCMWLQKKYGNLPVTLVGYSFGAQVVWSSLPLLTFTRAICIAPPNKFMDFMKHRQTLSNRVLFVVCEGDPFFNRYTFGELGCQNLVMLSGGDHFFSNQKDTLLNAIGVWLS